MIKASFLKLFLINVILIISFSCQNKKSTKQENTVVGTFKNINKKSEMHFITITHVKDSIYNINTRGINKSGKRISAHQKGSYSINERKIYSTISNFGLTLEFSEDYNQLNLRFIDILEEFNRTEE